MIGIIKQIFGLIFEGAFCDHELHYIGEDSAGKHYVCLKCPHSVLVKEGER